MLGERIGMSYFIWLIFGVIAFIIEMILPTFFALFAAIGFLVAGVVAFFFPESFFLQVMIASMFMIIGAIVFKKRNIADTNPSGVGTHNEFVGILGVAKSPISEHTEGDVELYESVVSSRHWRALSAHGEIGEGSEIRIVELRGNTLLVEKHIKG